MTRKYAERQWLGAGGPLKAEGGRLASKGPLWLGHLVFNMTGRACPAGVRGMWAGRAKYV